MWIENLYEPFEILIRERAVFPVDVHRHTFFELVYIVSGTGRLSAFGREVTYQPGDLFLIRAETAHRFVVETVSRFVFLRFTQQAVADCTGMLAEPFLSAQKEPDPLQLHEDDAGKIQGLFRLIWMERENPGLSCSDVLRQWSVSALLIVARNLAARTLPDAGVSPAGRLVWLLPYIQRHIGQPERLTTEALCEVFHFSKHYLGRYFRRHYQENLGSYITRCRLRAVENELLNSARSVKEIAWKLGFADASHLAKVFRRHTGKTPLQFRREHRFRQPDHPAADGRFG